MKKIHFYDRLNLQEFQKRRFALTKIKALFDDVLFPEGVGPDDFYDFRDTDVGFAKKRIPIRPQVSDRQLFQVAGIFEVKGILCTSTAKDSSRPTGWDLRAFWSLGNKDRLMLENARKVIFGDDPETICVNPELEEGQPVFSNDYCTLATSSCELINALVIPFHDDTGFAGFQKAYEYPIWKEIVALVQAEIKTSEQLERFLTLRKELGKYRASRYTHSDRLIRETFTPVE